MSGTKGLSPIKGKRTREITDSNPRVDQAQMREAARLLEKLESEGVERRGYGIASPYERVNLRHYTRRSI